MVKHFQKLLWTGLFIFILLSTAHADFTHSKNPELVDYYYQITNFPSADLTQSKCVAYISVPYDELVFVRGDSGFHANYSFAIYLFDKKKKNVLFKKEWTRELFTKSFEETNRRSNLDCFQTVIKQTPGKYRLMLMVEDKYVKKPFYKEIPLEIKDFKKIPIAITSVFLIDSLPNFEGDDFLFKPNVSNIFAKSFYAFFEVVKNTAKNPEILFRIRDAESKTILQRDTLRVSGGKQTFQFAPLVQVDSLHSGHYWAEVLVRGSRKKLRERTKFQVWKAMEFKNVKDIDRAIDALVYIAPSGVLDQMKRAKSFSDKKKLFARFWKGVDPTPETEINELQLEYYRRVAYANRHFEVLGQDGWRSDRGKIYILYGPPDSVEHQMDAQLRDYEIWRYKNLKRKFVFFDSLGNGNYRLIEKR